MKPNTYYIGYDTIQGAWYDSNKNYISGMAGGLNTAQQSPANAAYLRTSFRIENEATNRINEGQVLLPYSDYGSHQEFVIEGRVKELEKSVDELLDELEGSYLPNFATRTCIKADNLLANDTITINDTPTAVSGETITFYGKLTSFGNGFIIGKGTTGYSASWIEINDTSIKCYKYEGSNFTTLLEEVQHGLVFSDFIKVSIVRTIEKWVVSLSTLADNENNAGVFVTELNDHYGFGSPRVTSKGAVFTEVEFSYNCNDINKPIWAFGDSYFGSATPNRIMYWLNQWGYTKNFLQSSYGGENSSAALNELRKCLALGTPKIIIWCLGMNDNAGFENWLSYMNQVVELCNSKNITLIIGTIPQVLAPNVTYKDAMSNWIRTSGYRYIDIAKAVGSNSQGHWYGYGTNYDYQDSDNVHPSIYGAKAIAAQFLIDAPEITNTY